MINIGNPLSFSDIIKAINGNYSLALSESIREKVRNTRNFLEEKISSGEIMYGVNTGFGKLANTRIPNDEIIELQINLIRSHSAGQGKEIPPSISKLAMLLLLNSVAKGYSGIRENVLDSLKYAIEKDLIPISYWFGSLGASGDLAPLAHLVLGLTGEGPIFDLKHKQKYEKITEADPDFPIIKLDSKEGLALINGTHFSTAFLSFSTEKSMSLFFHSLINAALSSEALKAIITVYSPLIHNIRFHEGQKKTAEIINVLLEGSSFIKSAPDEEIVQNPYSIRCTPQIMGGIFYSIKNAIQTLEIEINSVTDNPLVFPEEKKVLSGGNFHGEPIGFAAEFLSLGLAKLASLSQVRTEKILNPAYNYGLPAFLVNHPGLNSGYMIAHYTQASLLNKVNVLANPVITGNIPVSAMQEDIVSMSMNAATKSFEISDLVEKIIAIELIVTIQALDLREKKEGGKSSPVLQNIRNYVRSKIEFLDKDRIIKNDIDEAVKIIQSKELLRIVSKNTGINYEDIFQT